MTDKTEVTEIPLNKIKAAPWQPREMFDKDKIKSLGESLKEKGIIQPIVVRKDKTGEGYELIAGERRVRAWSYTGKPTIPAVIKDVDDFTAKELSYLENKHRQDLTSEEEEKYTSDLWKEGIKLGRYTSYESMGKVLGETPQNLQSKIAANEIRNSIKIPKQHVAKLSTRDFTDTASPSLTKEARNELLIIKSSSPNVLPASELRRVSANIKEVPESMQVNVVKLISSEKLEPKNVERFVKVLKESPEDIQQKMLRQEITPDEAEEVRIFKTPEQRSQVIEERKIRKEEFAETTKRDVAVRKHMADEVEQGKEPTIIHNDFDANEKDDDASAQRIVERYQDIYLRVISFRADHILGIKNAEQQKQCIEIIKKTVAHCNAVLLGVDQLKTIIKYR